MAFRSVTSALFARLNVVDVANDEDNDDNDDNDNKDDKDSDMDDNNSSDNYSCDGTILKHRTANISGINCNIFNHYPINTDNNNDCFNLNMMTIVFQQFWQ